MQPEGDLWDHVLLVLRNLPANPSFPLAFAALLHDVGKPPTKSIHKGRFGFYNHEKVGRAIAEDLATAATLERRTRAGGVAGGISPVSRRGEKPPRVQAEAHPGRAGHRPNSSPCIAPMRWPRPAIRVRSTIVKNICAKSPPGRSVRRPWFRATTSCATG